MKGPTEAQKKLYVERGGVRCPFCMETDLHGGNVSISAGGALQDIQCPKCNARWADIYTLSDMVDVELSECTS